MLFTKDWYFYLFVSAAAIIYMCQFQKKKIAEETYITEEFFTVSCTISSLLLAIWLMLPNSQQLISQITVVNVFTMNINDGICF